MTPDNAGWWVLVALLLMLLGLVLFIGGCGEVQKKQEQKYAECIDRGGEWVQIGENQWTCEEPKEGTE